VPRSIHAVFFALNEAPFLRASVSAVYEFISGATVVTTYDRDRYGNPVEPEGLIELILSRQFDPDRKLQLIVTTEGNEPTTRNRAMAFADRQKRVQPIAGAPKPLAEPDIFWHIDADEIYDPGDVERLFAWVDTHPSISYRMHLRTYFRTWNWQVPEVGSFTALTRPRFRFGHIRDPFPSLVNRGWAKARREGWLSPSRAGRLTGSLLIPPEVAVCHHGSYVGGRDRIAAKMIRSSHRAEMADDWLTRVWDGWEPGMKNLHPTEPSRYPYATHVPTADLPSTIRNADWPEGWIER
jgi:hypothetical protein